MKGHIKKYNEGKGYGFIKSETGSELFFHLSNVKDTIPISEGFKVNFDTDKNEKGSYAKNIQIINIKMFIKIGEERIKLSNVKHYGVEKYKINNDSISNRIENASYLASFSDRLSAFLEMPTETIKYLYITTYQGDNYKFYDHEINFNQIIEELDTYFT